MTDLQKVEAALASPVFDPKHQAARVVSWYPERLVSAALTCNIGME